MGRVLDVRWVASSWKAVNVVWRMFPALCKHFSEASEDTQKDSKARRKYHGLKARLASPEFLTDLALMCDCLQELTILSKQLQDRSTTLINGQKHINRTIRVLDSFKNVPGEHMSEVLKIEDTMKFKNIQLFPNTKIIRINQSQFLTSLINNLKSRLLENKEDDMIIQDMQIMDLTNWPENIDIRFGETEVKRLCKRFMLNQENAINGMRQLIHDPTVLPKEIMPEFDNFYKTFPVSTAECERGFSLMNNICTKLRARLTMKNISNLMFININGPPLEKWDPKDYVKSWMVSHRSAEDTRTKLCRPAIVANSENKSNLWKIL